MLAAQKIPEPTPAPPASGEPNEWHTVGLNVILKLFNSDPSAVNDLLALPGFDAAFVAGVQDGNGATPLHAACRMQFFGLWAAGGELEDACSSS